jgi:hypothetical protein
MLAVPAYSPANNNQHKHDLASLTQQSRAQYPSTILTMNANDAKYVDCTSNDIHKHNTDDLANKPGFHCLCEECRSRSFE